jgi:hypothetical protein
LHRLEGDEGNARYWLGKVGAHPIFGELLEAAQSLLQQLPVDGWNFGPTWKPDYFNACLREAAVADNERKTRVACAARG